MKKKKKEKKQQLCVKTSSVKTVKWEDACNYASVSLEECIEKEPEIVETYGKIVHADKEYTIVMTHNAGGETNDYIRIPTSLIRS